MKSIVLMLAFATAVVGGPAQADPNEIIVPIGPAPSGEGRWVEIARCGGPLKVQGIKPALAPAISRCRASGTRTSILPTAISMHIGHGYTAGTITAQVTGRTFGGKHTLTCDVITQNPYFPVGSCRSSPGSIGLEQIDLDGTASGVGIWDVAYLQWVN